MALFLLPVLGSFFLHASGWRPGHTRNFGELIDPPQDINATKIRLADNTLLNWRNSDRRWTMLAYADSTCADLCLNQLDALQRARISLNKNMDRLRIVFIGNSFPTDQLSRFPSILFGKPEEKSASFPVSSEPDNLQVVLVDPAGLLMMRYSSGFDPNGLRKDLSRLIR